MKQDLLWEAAMETCYGEPSPNLTTPERKKLGKLLNSIRETGATPDELRARAKRYKEVMPPGCILTLAGLANNWGRCKPQPKTRGTTPYHELWQPPSWMK